MTRKSLPRTVICCLIERPDGSLGIVTRNATEENRQWEFPRTLRHPNESPEAAARRAADQLVGVEVAVEQGQPPLAGVHEGNPSQFRYFLCSMENGEARICDPYADFRWVNRAQLCEYDFVDPDRQVVQWYTS